MHGISTQGTADNKIRSPGPQEPVWYAGRIFPWLGSCRFFQAVSGQERGYVMAKFECNWCGKCCDSFGEFITIERQLTSRDYYCRYGITNEVFLVHVTPEFADEIDEAFTASDPKDPVPAKKGCTFSRKNPDGKGFACAIYETRPRICREFKCYRMLIHHPSTQELRGKVIGINELRTHDEILAAIWKEKISQLPHPIHAAHPDTAKTHGHDAHVLDHISDVRHGDDKDWVKNVVEVLAANGYQGDPVEE